MRMPLKTRLYYGVGRHLPFLKIRPPEVDRDAVLILRPGRNSSITWEQQTTGETILTIPLENSSNRGRINKFMSRWFRTPDERRVELDEVGAFVWELCDGNLTVEGIVQRASKKYKMNRREAEVSVTMFLQMLHERKFIGLYKKVQKKSQGDRVV